ncbi:MAG: T9SS type A sorting domain-containing protein, partial [Rhodothermales bacterium]|nr:T9SS type A sorting domain-containing protein [Rhodothermales bacterium]
YVLVFIGEPVSNERPLAIVDVSGSATAKSSADQHIAVVNAVQDGPALDFQVGSGMVVNAVEYGQHGTGVVSSGEHVVHVRRDADGHLIDSFRLAVGDAPGSVLPIVATGYLDPPAGVTDRSVSLMAADRTGGVAIPAVVTGIDDDAAGPTFRVTSVYPNPFRSRAHIVVELEEISVVEVKVFDVLGRIVDRIGPTRFLPGANRRIELRSANLPSGLYFLRVATTARGKTAATMETIVLAR